MPTQVALITLMAQIKFCSLQSQLKSVLDEILQSQCTSDDISSGQSTLCLEMTEVSRI